jgi:DNA-directed RNA polymerase subunit RPC12/RpoP
MADDDDVRCPKCGSARVHADQRGWSFWTGTIGSGKTVITCLKCGHRFNPGEGVQRSQTPTPPPMPQQTRDAAPAQHPTATCPACNQLLSIVSMPDGSFRLTHPTGAVPPPLRQSQSRQRNPGPPIDLQ